MTDTEKNLNLCALPKTTTVTTNIYNASEQCESVEASIPWVEKYRPTQFDHIVLDHINRNLFQQILDKNYFPNLLFYGPPGTGKTTTIINLINEYQTRYNRPNKSNIIHLNASDERGIDIIRNQIYSFVKAMNLFETGMKFVILDEVDYMTRNAQQALKYLLQTTSTNVRFCLICNYISKIETSLQNEFICVRFNQLPKSDIFKFIKKIAINENIKIDDSSIETIQTMYHSDIRCMVNFLQLNQGIQMDEWNKNIMSTSVLENLNNKISSNEPIPNIILLIRSLSVQYNVDIKHIVHSFFNYIIRYHQTKVSPQFLEIVSIVVHNENTKLEDMLFFFCVKMKELLYIQK